MMDKAARFGMFALYSVLQFGLVNEDHVLVGESSQVQ